MRRATRIVAGMAVLALLTGANDPNNPTCPATPDWGPAARMTLTTREQGDMHILVAEGIIDDTLPDRLKRALDGDDKIGEIWIRSRGGDARAGNLAGKVIRSFPGMVTRIPAGWTCFSACNFLFMGGAIRHIDQGGLFIVHMFTFTSDPNVRRQVAQGQQDSTIGVIADVEQGSAMLASEDNDFLIRMGVSRTLLSEVMYKQQAVGTDENPTTRYCLTQDEMVKYGVTNGEVE